MTFPLRKSKALNQPLRSKPAGQESLTLREQTHLTQQPSPAVNQIYRITLESRQFKCYIRFCYARVGSTGSQNQLNQPEVNPPGLNPCLTPLLQPIWCNGSILARQVRGLDTTPGGGAAMQELLGPPPVEIHEEEFRPLISGHVLSEEGEAPDVAVSTV
ncbi:hypothetical protein J6590_096890 [Homalodisca vitripennis]|nr:hypothetical protein J6590_096890 [Homalodisca vitripennis]